jgi:hypothetical protein
VTGWQTTHLRENDHGDPDEHGGRRDGLLVLLDGGAGSLLRPGGEGLLRHGGDGRRMRLPVAARDGTLRGRADALAALSPRTHPYPVREMIDIQADESLWRDHRERLVRFVQRRVEDPATAEDIVHDVLLRAYASATRSAAARSSNSGSTRSRATR